MDYEARQPRTRGIGGGAALATAGAVVDRLFRRESGRAVARPDPRARRLRPRRGGGPGGVRRRARALAARRRPAQPGRRGSRRPPATGRSTGCAASARSRRSSRELAALERARRPASDPDEDMSAHPRRPAAADLHLLPPGARARGAGGAHAAHARRASRRRRSRARSSSPSRRWRSGSCAPSARSATPASAYEVPEDARAAATGCGSVLAVALPDLQRGLLRRRPATRSSAASCATRRSGSAACSSTLMPERAGGARACSR